eukprot:SAG31_NODE_6743_length_1903_cov_1.521064_3_plen_291_part_01
MDVVRPLLDAGTIDLVLATLTAYQVLRPSEISVTAICWGTLFLLETLVFRSKPVDAERIAEKLRTEARGSFRHLLDNPLCFFGDFGFESGVIATRIAASIWGRDEQHSGAFVFKQDDINKILRLATNDGAGFAWYPMDDVIPQAVLSLCVSDANKDLLLASDTDVTSVLVEGLLLSPDHPRKTDGRSDFERYKGEVQRNHAEAIHQLALYGPGRDTLLRAPTLVANLHEVAKCGFTAKARKFAAGALVALCPPEEQTSVDNETALHIMMSCKLDYTVLLYCFPVSSAGHRK